MTETDPNVDDVRREVRDAMACGALSQSQVARQSGLSSPVVSQFLGDSYLGNNAAVAAKLRAWLGGLAAAEKLRPTLLAPSAFVPTEAAEQITKTVDYAQADARLVAIIGEPGVGKTRSAEQGRASRSSVWLVTMKRDARSPFPMLQEIARTMGTGPAGSGADRRAPARHQGPLDRR
jgi:DNA transposition AAA+ family ATPase